MLLAAILFFALTRAEIVQRMKAPVNTQADGLVKVYAYCDEDMRREFQGPIGSFAGELMARLYASQKLKSRRFASPGIIIQVGNERTNITDVVTRVVTNDSQVVTRLYLQSPGTVDLERFRLELIRGFFRSVKNSELSLEEARERLLEIDPRYRVNSLRSKIDAWLKGDRAAKGDDKTDEEWDEEHLALMRRVIEPGFAAPQDVLVFASRLYLYPRYFDEKFLDGSDVVSFRDAVKLAKIDPRVGILAHFKAIELPILGGGRGEKLDAAAEAYARFLRALAAGEKTDKELYEMLENADKLLQLTWEMAK